MSDTDLSEVKFHVNLVPTGAIKASGLQGRHYYEEGRSVEALSLREALRIGASGEAVDDDGVQIHSGNFNLLADKYRAPAPEVAEEVVETQVEVPVETQVEVIPHKVWTQAELEKIADKVGIVGLREIADGLNVKGRSIPEMITLIVAKQRAG